jgi:hypothetical protein
VGGEQMRRVVWERIGCAGAKDLHLFEVAAGLGVGTVVIGAESGEHGFEALAIFVGRGEESQAEAGAAFNVPNDGVGFDAALLNEEVELRGHAFSDFEVRSLDEEAVDADVENAGDVVAAVAAPADPDVFRGWETGEGPAGVGWFVVHEGLPGARHVVWGEGWTADPPEVLVRS